MTRRALPKPVEAWGRFYLDGTLATWDGRIPILWRYKSEATLHTFGAQRFRIVPIPNKTKKPAKGRRQK